MKKPLIVGVLVIAAFFGFMLWLGSNHDVKTKSHLDYNEVTIKYKGHPLYCVAYDRGVSCDWQRWHQEAGR